MTNSQFEQMDLKALREYVLSHSDDEAAFHIYLDRRRALNPNPVTYPPTTTPEGLEIMQKAIRERLGLPADENKG